MDSEGGGRNVLDDGIRRKEMRRIVGQRRDTHRLSPSIPLVVPFRVVGQSSNAARRNTRPSGFVFFRFFFFF